MVLSKSPVKKIMKSQSTDKLNVSPDAVEIVRLSAEEYIADLTKKALTYTKNSGRKTIQRKDVQAVFDSENTKDTDVDEVEEQTQSDTTEQSEEKTQSDTTEQPEAISEDQSETKLETKSE